MSDELQPEDDELVLEPVDPDIVAHQRQRAQQKTDHAQVAVDADLIRKAEEQGDSISLENLKKINFDTRHLMILTALLALVRAFCQFLGAGLGLFISAVIAVSAGWFFTMRHQRRQRNAVDRLRYELAAQQELTSGQKTGGQETRQLGKEGSTATGNRTTDIDNRPAQEPGQDSLPAEQPDLSFSFSLKEMLIASVSAAMLLGLANLFGTDLLAVLLGMIALGGLVALAVRMEVPSIVVFGWWILLVLYLLQGLWSSTAAAP